MWEVVGSWPFVAAMAVIGAALPVAAWLRSDRGARRLIAAGAVVLVGWIGVTVAMNLPLTVDGAVCNDTATPAGVHGVSYDAHTEAELRSAGVDASRFSCRDGLRSRYLLIGAGYVVWTLVGSALIARRTVRVT